MSPRVAARYGVTEGDGKTDPEGRAARTFAEASIPGSRLVEGMDNRPPTAGIFNSLLRLLSKNRSKNRSKTASFLNFSEESAQLHRLLLDKLPTQYTWCHSCMCLMLVMMRRIKNSLASLGLSPRADH